MRNLFSDGDIICFLGDSITARGILCAEVYQTLGKKKRIKCYNCGVSGSSTKYAKDYLYTHCLNYNPTHVAIMFGINDINRSYYSDSYTSPGKETEIRSAMELHKICYEEIVKRCIAFGAKVILSIPVPYDEISDSAEENLHCQRGLDESAEFIRLLAEKYGCAVVDYDKVMRPMLTESVIGADRVHPTDYGYHVMAQVFMRDTGIIDECDFATPFEFEDWNKERYDAERALKDIYFVEYCAIFKKSREERLTVAEKKALALSQIEKTNHPGIKEWLAIYANEIDFREEYEARLIEKSIFVKE